MVELKNKIAVEFSDREKKLVLDFAERFQRSEYLSDRIKFDKIERASGETEKDLENIIEKFARYQLVKWETNVSLLILPQVVAVANQIQNQPPKNYLKEIITWLLSSPWRAGAVAVILGVPLFVQWLEGVQTLVDMVISKP